MRSLGTVVFQLGLAFALFSSASTLGAQDARAAGMSWSCQELNSRWPVYHRDFKVKWALAPFTCPSPVASIVEAMALLHDMVSQPDSNGNVPDYYGWLARTERGMDYSNEEKAGAMAHYHGTSVITIMNPFFKAPLTQRAAMLVHEGRHAMWPADPGHVTCAHGASQGTAGACDAEFVKEGGGGGGGYSWGWLFMWHLMEDPNAVPAEHDRILWLLKWELNNRFNNLRDEDKAFFMQRWNWDGK